MIRRLIESKAVRVALVALAFAIAWGVTAMRTPPPDKIPAPVAAEAPEGDSEWKPMLVNGQPDPNTLCKETPQGVTCAGVLGPLKMEPGKPALEVPAP